MSSQVSQERLAVCELVREAFAGVRLGNGVGLTEADAIDDYADDETRKNCHRLDEKDDWSKIPFEKLQRYSHALSFSMPKECAFTFQHS